MPAGFALSTVVLAAILAGGLVKGLVGFGSAVVSTTLVASLLDPATGVAVLIVPTLAANLHLLGSLDGPSMRACARRFWPYVAAATAGTLFGMALLSRVPRAAVALGLGAVTLGYVLEKQDRVGLAGEAWLRDRRFRSTPAAKAGLGFVSGGHQRRGPGGRVPRQPLARPRVVRRLARRLPTWRDFGRGGPLGEPGRRKHRR